MTDRYGFTQGHYPSAPGYPPCSCTPNAPCNCSRPNNNPPYPTQPFPPYPQYPPYPSETYPPSSVSPPGPIYPSVPSPPGPIYPSGPSPPGSYYPNNPYPNESHYPDYSGYPSSHQHNHDPHHHHHDHHHNHHSWGTPPPPTGCVAQGYYWIDWTANRQVPSTAVHGGVDQDGTQIYVGRAQHENDWIPAKVIPQKRVAYVCYNGKEYPKDRFQVLCEQRFEWVPSHGGSIPPGAVEGGRTREGETLYIGRVRHQGSQTVGKVHPSHKTCYIPFDGKEVPYKDYEVLVLRG